MKSNLVISQDKIPQIIEKLRKGSSDDSLLSKKNMELISFLDQNLSESKDKEEIFDVSIDILNRMGFEFSFIAIFREDRKYSSAVRIRVDSDLVNRVEDYVRKMLPSMTVMRYRIPIFEDGRIYRKFLLEQTKPLVTDNVTISNPDDVFSSNINDLYDNLISKDSPLALLLPAFKRIVPYKSGMSTHLFINGVACGNIGIASEKQFTEQDLNALIIMSAFVAEALDKIGFGKNYIS